MAQRPIRQSFAPRRALVLLGLLLFSCIGALTPSRVAAGNTIVNFDDLHTGDVVGTQYASQGVTFVTNGPTSETPTLPTVKAVAGTTSAPNAASLRHCGGEFCQNLAMAHFDPPRSHVSVNVSDGRGQATASLIAYDEVGPIADSTGASSVPVESGSFAGLEVSSSKSDISYVTISGHPENDILIDDLAFGAPAPPPPPASTGSVGAPPASTAVPLPPKCSINVASPVFSIGPNGSTTVTLVVRRSGAWSGGLTFHTTLLSPNTSADFTPVSVSGPGTDEVHLTLSAVNAAPGANPITVTGISDAGDVSCSAAVTLTVTAPVNLVVKGFEVTSGVQIDHLPQRTGVETSVAYFGVLLPEGKKTVVRVFVAASDGPPTGVPNVEATLTGYRPGSSTPLAGGPLHPQWGLQTVSVDPSYNVDEQRKDPTQGFAFVLPPAWTTGNIELEASATAPGGSLSGECGADCTARKTLRLTGVSFTPVKDVHVVPVAMVDGIGGALPAPAYTCITWKDMGGYSIPANPYTCPNNGVFADARQVTPVGMDHFHLADYYAFIDVHDQIAHTYNPTNPLADQTERGKAVGSVLWHLANDREDVLLNTEDYDPRASNIIMGVHPDGKGIRGAARGAECRVSSGIAECDEWRVAIVPATGRPLTGVAHELWHMYGFFHASKCTLNPDAKPPADVGNFTDWPPDQQGRMQGYGLDTRDGSGLGTGGGPFRVLGDEAGPDRISHKSNNIIWHDLMGYCASEPDAWISTKNWNEFVTAFAARDPHAPVQPAVAGGAPVPALLATSPPTLTVTAFTAGDGVVFFGTVGPTGRHRAGPDAASPYHLIARDASGAQIADVGMATQQTHADPGSSATDLIAQVPSTNVASVEIRKDGRVVASRTRNGAAPTAQFTAPQGGEMVDGQPLAVSWTTTASSVRQTGGDTSGVSRFVSLDYSIDDGKTWRLVYAGPDQGSAQVPAKLLAGADHARLRLTINDGFQEGSAVSAPFRSAGADPAVQILSPSNNGRLAGGANIFLSAEGYNDQGRRLRDNQMAWYVNDNQVATGRLASISNLPKGGVVLKLIGTDDHGRLGGAQVCLWVSAQSVDPAGSPSACHPPALRDPRTGRLVGFVPAPGGEHRPYWLLAILGAFLLVLLGVIGWELSARRRRSTSPRG
ncbi:MAG: hypothetical protein JF887_05130 [Candidatus Dormibacteraeota bacterium]|uniref:Uncharacterized protein n=1 Tax=Candidatus Amunia macphersoniae TaxID=3127014 RepID=A0A934NJ23_9BACT|nr:hypothetical protein [Candidatus Dormibacteraeota bacterium]